MLSLWKIIVQLGAKPCKCQRDPFGQMSGEKQDPEGQASLNIIAIQSKEWTQVFFGASTAKPKGFWP